MTGGRLSARPQRSKAAHKTHASRGARRNAPARSKRQAFEGGLRHQLGAPAGLGKNVVELAKFAVLSSWIGYSARADLDDRNEKPGRKRNLRR